MTSPVTIKVDDRETGLFASLTTILAERESDIRATKERLPLADVHIVGDIEVLVERKRTDDFMASFFDGRLAEQEQRLAEARVVPGVWTVVIVEGVASAATFLRTDQPLNRYRLFLKTYVQESMRSGVPQNLLLRTTCTEETAHVLLTLHRTLLGRVAPEIPRRYGGRRRPDVFVAQLCCTQGVSSRRAQQLRTRFSNMAALVAGLNDVGARGIAPLVGGMAVAKRLYADILQRSDDDSVVRAPASVAEGPSVGKGRRLPDGPKRRKYTLQKKDTQQKPDHSHPEPTALDVAHEQNDHNVEQKEYNNVPGIRAAQQGGVVTVSKPIGS